MTSPATDCVGGVARRSVRRKIVRSAVVCTLLIPPSVELLARLLLIGNPASWILPGHFPAAEVPVCCGPIQGHWTMNGRGFHDREHARERSTGTARLVCIGDSFLEGPQERPFPERLERHLAGTAAEAEVINLSYSGLGIEDYYLLLREVALDDRPDLVLVAICGLNDLMNLTANDRDLRDYEDLRSWFARYPERSVYGTLFPLSTVLLSDLWSGRPLPTRWSRPRVYRAWDAARPSFTLEQLASFLHKKVGATKAQVLERLRTRLTAAEQEELASTRTRLDLLGYLLAAGLSVPQDVPAMREGLRAFDSHGTDAALDRALQYLRSMRRRCEATGAALLVVFLPTPDVDPDCARMYQSLAGSEPALFVESRRRVRALARRLADEGQATLDLADSMRGLPGAYLRFDGHWTEDGAEWAATAVAEALVERGALR